MSESGLTSNNTHQHPAPLSLAPPLPDSAEDGRPEPPPKSAPLSSDFLSSLSFRALRRSPSKRDPDRDPSDLSLPPKSASAIPSRQPSHRSTHHTPTHSRNQSLLDSLQKPLPEPPPLVELIPIDIAQKSTSTAAGTATTIATTTISSPGRETPTPPTPPPPPPPKMSARAESRPKSIESFASADLATTYMRHPAPHISHSSSQASLALHDAAATTASLSKRSSNSHRSLSTAPPPHMGPAVPPPNSAVPFAHHAHHHQARPSSYFSPYLTNDLAQSLHPAAHLTGLVFDVCNTTGSGPGPRVGVSTTVMGDKLYVFGGRIMPPDGPPYLTAELHELDLVRRHWTRLEPTGDIPLARYFHSLCALGDTKLVCFGGMAVTTTGADGNLVTGDGNGAELSVMSDLHILDLPTLTWTFIPVAHPPGPRYAHCATIIPTSATFTSHRAPLAALQHNPSTDNHPHAGSIGIQIDGHGGAEMVVVGGQDTANKYIEQINIFNLRSLKWTRTQHFTPGCGAYRSTIAAFPTWIAAQMRHEPHRSAAAVNNSPFQPPGTGTAGGQDRSADSASASQTPTESKDMGTSILIYTNYTGIPARVGLYVRSSDGTVTDKTTTSAFTPPRLRFSTAGVIGSHFILSGTLLNDHQEPDFQLWALDLKRLTWSHIKPADGALSLGSWNRGLLWARRNKWVVLGDREGNLHDDYTHRRVNFANVCLVDLEAVGLYANPRKASPMSGFVSASSPYPPGTAPPARRAGATAGGRWLSKAAADLGAKVLAIRELADMEILCVGGERVPINSRLVARRWGPYFVQLLREGAATQAATAAVDHRDNNDSNENSSNNQDHPHPHPPHHPHPHLHPNTHPNTHHRHASSIAESQQQQLARNSIITITTPATTTTGSRRDSATTLASTASGASASSSFKSPPSMTTMMAMNMTDVASPASPSHPPPPAPTAARSPQPSQPTDPLLINAAPTPRSLLPDTRPRCLYLPHTYLTVQSLMHYLYTSSLPPPTSPLCTPQILCSLLQIARPYRVDGLLEAVVERVHSHLDRRNAAALFNAAAMAAGNGCAIHQEDYFTSPRMSWSSRSAAGHDSDVEDEGSGDGDEDAYDGESDECDDDGEPADGASTPSSSVDPPAVTKSASKSSCSSRSRSASPRTAGSRASSSHPPASESTTSMASLRPPSTDHPTRLRRRRRRRRTGASEYSITLGGSDPDADADEVDQLHKSNNAYTPSKQQQQPSLSYGEPVLSSLIGLQKRGLRGLMEGRRLRERKSRGRSMGQSDIVDIVVSDPSSRHVGLGIGPRGMRD